MGKYQLLRTPTPNTPPTGLLEGELGVEMATPTRLWVGVPTTLDATGRKLLNGGTKSLIISDTVPPTPVNNEQFWWESDTGTLYIFYDDGTSQQWVQVGGTGSGAPLKELLARVEVLEAALAAR